MTLERQDSGAKHNILLTWRKITVLMPLIDEEAYNLFDLPKITGTPERCLLLAILERAILDYVGNDPVEVQGAENWLFECDSASQTQENAEPFSFLWICEQLDLNPVQIAGIIKRMPRRGNHRVAPWYFDKGYFDKGYFVKENILKSVA